MMKKFGLVVLIASLAGCGGVEISSLSDEEAEKAHQSGHKIPGYIVYHPMIVVEVKEIIEKEVETEDSIIREYGKIKECVVGKPQTLPDYEKPFLLRLKPGIGKSSVDLKIEDGWRLDGIKTESDNTALLQVLQKIVTQGASVSLMPSDGTCELKPGLYRLSLEKGSVELKLKPIPIKPNGSTQ